MTDCSNYINPDDLIAAKEATNHIERVASSPEESVTDSIRGENVTNLTLNGFENKMEKAILAAGYVLIDSFQQGAQLPNNELTLRNQALRDESTGEYLRWNGPTLPKRVPPGSTPESTGGPVTPEKPTGLWTSVGDASLRAFLSTWRATALIDAGSLTVFQKHGIFGDGGSVASLDSAVRYTDGYWYIYTGDLPHAYNDSLDDDWVNVGLLNGYQVNSIENYGAIPFAMVMDNAIPINKCIEANHLLRRKTIVGRGTFYTRTSVDMLMGDHYSKHGTFIEGQGVEATAFIMIGGDSTESVIRGPDSATAKYNASVMNLSVYGSSANLAAIGFRSEISRVNIKGVRSDRTKRGIDMPRDAWINSFTGLNLNGSEYGINMDASGTTNTFDEIFVYGAKVCAYKIRTSYSTIGSLAADDCTGGAIYDFRFCNGLSVGALGFEQPLDKYPTRVVNLDNSTAVHINTITAWNGTPTDGVTPFDLVDSGNAKGAKVSGISLTNTRGGEPVNGSLVTGYTGSVELGDINLPGVSFKPTTKTTDISLSLKTEKTIGVFFNRPHSKPLIAGGAALLKGIGLSAAQEARKIPSVYGDNLGSPIYGSGSNDGELPAPKVGDIFLCNEPWKYGVFAYECIESGSSLASSRFGIIPCIVDSATPPSNPAGRGVQWFDSTAVKLKYWNGSAWV